MQRSVCAYRCFEVPRQRSRAVEAACEAAVRWKPHMQKRGVLPFEELFHDALRVIRVDQCRIEDLFVPRVRANRKSFAQVVPLGTGLQFATTDVLRRFIRQDEDRTVLLVRTLLLERSEAREDQLFAFPGPSQNVPARFATGRSHAFHGLAKIVEALVAYALQKCSRERGNLSADQIQCGFDHLFSCRLKNTPFRLRVRKRRIFLLMKAVSLCLALLLCGCASAMRTTVDPAKLLGPWFADGPSFELVIQERTILFEVDMQEHPYRLDGDVLVIQLDDGEERQRITRLTADEMEWRDEKFGTISVLYRKGIWDRG